VKSRPCPRNLGEFLLNLSAKRHNKISQNTISISKENIEKAKKIRIDKNPFLIQPSVFYNFFFGGGEGLGGGRVIMFH
jgi:hypothetical protein